jgi:hypothetical protein
MVEVIITYPNGMLEIYREESSLVDSIKNHSLWEQLQEV